MSESRPNVPETVSDNVNAILEVERRSQDRVSLLARISHAFGDAVGSVQFAAFHLALFAIWLLLNCGSWPSLMFDPYPFTFLGTVVSCEAVILATFVLIKQNREGERAEKRSHLDLQVNLMTEREVTKVLQIVQRLSERSGDSEPADTDLRELMEHTSVEELATQVEGIRRADDRK